MKQITFEQFKIIKMANAVNAWHYKNKPVECTIDEFGGGNPYMNSAAEIAIVLREAFVEAEEEWKTHSEKKDASDAN